jgi:protocatechuate 3,4-dioxygenase beta subunit
VGSVRNVNEYTLTDAVIASFSKSSDARFRFLIEKLVRHLHDYARETQLTPGEWKTAIDFLYNAGKISDDARNEFMLTSDVLGLSSLVDLLQSASNKSEGATERSVLGPFHSDGSPLLEVGGDLKRDNEGETLLVRGCVTDSAGKPVAHATLDFWQAAANGFYWQQDASQDKNNLRCKMITNNAGHYAFTTIRPAPYTVPYDGPVGGLLRAGGRHAWRPSHLHFIVSADGFCALTTEVFFADDKYVDEDAVFGVRESLVVKSKPATEADACAHGLKLPCHIVDFDFCLAGL